MLECRLLGCENTFQGPRHHRSSSHKHLGGTDKLVEKPPSANQMAGREEKKRKPTTQQLSLCDYRTPSSPKKQPAGSRDKTKKDWKDYFISAPHHPTGALLAVAVPSAVVAGTGAAAGTCGERRGGLTFWDILDSSSEKIQGKHPPRLQKQGLLPARAA